MQTGCPPACMPFHLLFSTLFFYQPGYLSATLNHYGMALGMGQLEEKDAEAFCDTFKLLHEELVNKALSLDAIERIAKRWPLATK
jgi:hypothetical protein